MAPRKREQLLVEHGGRLRVAQLRTYVGRQGRAQQPFAVPIQQRKVVPGDLIEHELRVRMASLLR